MAWARMITSTSAIIFCGASTTPPTKRPDNENLSEGDLYYNTGLKALYVYANGSWLEAKVVSASSPPTFLGNYNYLPAKRPDQSALIAGDTLFFTPRAQIGVYGPSGWVLPVAGIDYGVVTWDEYINSISPTRQRPARVGGGPVVNRDTFLLQDKPGFRKDIVYMYYQNNGSVIDDGWFQLRAV